MPLLRFDPSGSINADFGVTEEQVRSLPPCLRRCGVVPANVTLLVAQCEALLDVMAIANADAAQA